MDCHTRELLGWQLSKTGKSSTAISAVEHALINRFRCLGKVPEEDSLLSDEISAYFDAMITLIARFEEAHFKF